MLEDILKDSIKTKLEIKLGYTVSITHSDWEETKADVLNDIYVNKFCLSSDVTIRYFIDTMVDLFAIKKRTAA